MINPNIALSVEPPKPLDIAGAFQKAAALRSAANQNTIQKQAIEQNAQAIRDQELARKDDELVRKAWIEAGGKDDDFLKRIKTSGVSPERITKHETAIATKRAAYATLDKNELETMKARWENLRSLFMGVLDKKDPKEATAFMNKAFEIGKAQKLITEDELSRLQGIMPNGWNPEDARMLINSWTSEGNLAKEASNRFVEVQPGNTVINTQTREPIFTALPKVTEPTGDYREFLQTYYPGWLEKNKLTKSATNEMQAYQEWQKEKKSFSQSVDQQQMDDWLKKHPGRGPSDYYSWQRQQTPTAVNRTAVDEAIDRMAKEIAGGNLTSISKLASLRNESRIVLMDRIMQINPNFNMSELDRKIKLLDYYEVGKGRENLQSLDTFLQHAAEVVDVAETLKTTDSRLLNRSMNWWREKMSNSPELKALETALEPAHKEFESYLLGGRALYTDDRQQMQKIVNPNSTIAEIYSAIKQMGKTVKDRYVAQNHSYKRLMKTDLKNAFSEEALIAAEKIGIKLPTSDDNETVDNPKQPTSFSVSYQGKTYTFPDQKSADGFKKELGIK